MQCGLFQKTYTAEELKTTDFLSEPLRIMADYLGEELIGVSYLKKIAALPIPEDRFTAELSNYELPQGRKQDFKATCGASQSVTPEMLLSGVKLPWYLRYY